MLASLVAGATALWRRDFRAHGHWMLRAYAIGMGAGTQVLTHVPWMVTGGELSEGSRAVAMGAGWVINVVVAEVIITRTRRARRNSAGRCGHTETRGIERLGSGARAA